MLHAVGGQHYPEKKQRNKVALQLYNKVREKKFDVKIIDDRINILKKILSN